MTSSVLITAHAVGASLALTLGGWQLLRRPRGDRAHRLVGRTWVVLMYWTVLSSFFIRELVPGSFSWIHLLSILTFVTLTLGVRAALRGNIEAHRGFMRGTYFGLLGAFVGAVAVPARDVPQLVVHRPLAFVVLVVMIVVATAAIVALCSRPVRHDRPVDVFLTQSRKSAKLEG